MKLCLIVLPNPTLSNPKMYFPLGVLYLASVARRGGYSVEIVDMRDGEKPLPVAEYYGFSCSTPEITKAKELAQRVNGITIVGGAHSSLVPEDCQGFFDIIVVGEGEEVLGDILSGKIAKGATIVAQRLTHLEHISYPAWDLTPEPFSLELFRGEKYGSGERAMTVMCSRGCPYNCHFCANVYRTPVIYRSVLNILGEIRELMLLGISHFKFEDDNFNIHPEFEELCQGLRELQVKWKCHTRSELIALEQAKLMKGSGCEEVGLGVESADDNVLKINNKGETAEDHRRAIETLKQAGLSVKPYFMAGLPGETDLTLEINKEFFRQVKPDKWALATFTPYPGSAIYKNPERFHVKIMDWNYSHWWNFCENKYNHQLTYESQDKTWNRYLNFYNWLKKGEWQK